MKRAARKRKGAGGIPVPGCGGCCQVDSLVSVDERGQMVLPKGLRDKAGIRPGEKLVAVACARGEEVCCICLVKADALKGLVQGVLGPVLKDLADLGGKAR